MLIDHPITGRLIYHVVSGDLFYTSMALLGLAAAMRMAGAWWPMYRWRRPARLAGVLGVMGLAVTLGSMSVWWLLYLFALVLGASLSRHARRGRMLLAVLATGLAALAVVDAWRYERGLGPEGKAYPGVVVFGDSLSAADPRQARPWPERLGERIGWPVVNLSVPGATAGTGAEIVARHEVRASLVIVALGGNDVVLGTRVRRYADSLDALLARLIADDNDVVLIEVPAPPEAPWYGWSQRRLAARHGVRLVPKRVLAGALLITGRDDDAEPAADARVLHDEGHERLARDVTAYLHRWFADPDAAAGSG